MRVKQVTQVALSRTVGMASALGNGAHCAGTASLEKSVPSLNTSSLLCQAPPGLRKLIALALLFSQKKIHTGLNHVCCLSLPSVCVSPSLRMRWSHKRHALAPF